MHASHSNVSTTDLLDHESVWASIISSSMTDSRSPTKQKGKKTDCNRQFSNHTIGLAVSIEELGRMYAVPCFLVIALAFMVTTDGGALQADQRECRFKPKLPKCRRQPPGRLGQGGRFCAVQDKPAALLRIGAQGRFAHRHRTPTMPAVFNP